MKDIKHVVGLSGGKDSTCLAIALREKLPNIDFEYICTPTGNELPELFEHLNRMENILGKPVIKIGIGKTLHDLIHELKMIPNFRARWCTRMLKIEPTIEYMQTLPKGSKLYVGLRSDEEDRAGIYGDDIESVFPFKLWGWTEKDVWKFLDDRHISIPIRTDCGDCYHQRIIEWRNYWRDYPDRYAESVKIEQQYGHTFRSPGRDTWPVSLFDLAKEFESGRKIRGEDKINTRGTCRVCSL